MLAKAISIAAQWYEKIKDKGGKPYILHCIRVMNNLCNPDEELQCVAILHDCVEDGIIDIQDLYNYWFTARVCEAVVLLTHSKLMSYDEYIQWLSFNKDAVLVKIADLKDNSDITRLKWLREKDLERMAKYHKAYIYLSSLPISSCELSQQM